MRKNVLSLKFVSYAYWFGEGPPKRKISDRRKMGDKPVEGLGKELECRVGEGMVGGMSGGNGEGEKGRQSETILSERTKRPPLYKVLLHNDDYTTMEFVIYILQEVFHRPLDEAKRIMLKVHQTGVGVCGVYTYEIAETKAHKVRKLAREKEHPLMCSLEPEDSGE